MIKSVELKPNYANYAYIKCPKCSYEFSIDIDDYNKEVNTGKYTTEIIIKLQCKNCNVGFDGYARINNGKD